jgi:phosphate/sulfate permease
MNPIVGNIIGWGLVAAVVWFMITTVIQIHRDLGLLSTRGFLWLLAVLVGSLFGVILYRFFRDSVEYICETLFERWSA